jgi:hypothetical protein
MPDVDAMVLAPVDEIVESSTFLEKALVSRVKRRIPIRIVRFCRST